MFRHKILNLTMMIIAASLQFSCIRDPYDGVTSNERSIENVSLGGGLIQVGPAVIDRINSKAQVKVLVKDGLDLSKVVTNIQPSYRSSVTPSSGEVINFKAGNNKFTYKVTSESGQTKEWEVEIVPFSETILGTYKIEGLVLYGGTGPEYQGGAVVKLTDKNIWPALGGPAAEMDNELTFEFTGATADGKTTGKFSNSAGNDGTYANFLFVGDPQQTDVNNFYRKLPKGEGTWTRDYSANTVTFKFQDGTTTTGVFENANSEDLGNGYSKTIENNALVFTLNGTDDWDNFGSDYDKFVKKPRKFWIDIKKQ